MQLRRKDINYFVKASTKVGRCLCFNSGTVSSNEILEMFSGVIVILGLFVNVICLRITIPPSTVVIGRDVSTKNGNNATAFLGIKYGQTNKRFQVGVIFLERVQ